MDEIDSQPKKSPTLTFAGGVVGFLLFTGITAYVFWDIKKEKHPIPYETDRADVRAKNLTELRDSIEALRSSYGWVDKQQGIVRLPVQRSMEVVLPELQASKPRPSGVKVPPPVVDAPAEPAAAEAGKADPSAAKASTAPAAAAPGSAPAKASPVPAAAVETPGSLFPPTPVTPEAAPQ